LLSSSYGLCHAAKLKNLDLQSKLFTKNIDLQLGFFLSCSVAASRHCEEERRSNLGLGLEIFSCSVESRQGTNDLTGKCGFLGPRKQNIASQPCISEKSRIFEAFFETSICDYAPQLWQ